MVSARALSQFIWGLCDLLRDDGIAYQDYISELTWLLFLRISDAQPATRGSEAAGAWRTLTDTAPGKRLEVYKAKLAELRASTDPLTAAIFDDARTAIRHSGVIDELANGIAKVEWDDSDPHLFGDVYEGLLERSNTEVRSGAGQYFTPRFLVDRLVEIIDPKRGEIIQDPAVGTGGFLIAAHRHIELSRPSRRRTQFVGVEIVPNAYRLCQMNMFVHGVPAEIHLGNTLTGLGRTLPPADVVLSNPPFGTKRGAGTNDRSDFAFPTNNKQLAFLQHIYGSLKPNGRAAVVVPDGVMFEMGVGRSVRQDLLGRAHLRAVLMLPAGLFYAAGVRTQVLFIEATGAQGTRSTLHYDARAGFTSKASRRVLPEVLATFAALYRKPTDLTDPRATVLTSEQVIDGVAGARSSPAATESSQLVDALDKVQLHLTAAQSALDRARKVIATRVD